MGFFDNRLYRHFDKLMITLKSKSGNWRDFETAAEELSVTSDVRIMDRLIMELKSADWRLSKVIVKALDQIDWVPDKEKAGIKYNIVKACLTKNDKEKTDFTNTLLNSGPTVALTLIELLEDKSYYSSPFLSWALFILSRYKTEQVFNFLLKAIEIDTLGKQAGDLGFSKSMITVLIGIPKALASLGDIRAVEPLALLNNKYHGILYRYKEYDDIDKLSITSTIEAAIDVLNGVIQFSELNAEILRRKIINQRDDYNGATNLHYAVREGNIDLVKKLLKIGADPNGRANMKGFSTSVAPLHIAAKLGLVEIAAALLEAGADLNATAPSASRKLETPTRIASVAGHKDMANLLQRRKEAMEEEMRLKNYNTPEKKRELAENLLRENPDWDLNHANEIAERMIQKGYRF